MTSQQGARTAHAPYGERIAGLRRAAGLSQTALAHALGVQPGAISHIEAGRVLPKANRLRRLATILEVELASVVP